MRGNKKVLVWNCESQEAEDLPFSIMFRVGIVDIPLHLWAVLLGRQKIRRNIWCTGAKWGEICVWSWIIETCTKYVGNPVWSLSIKALFSLACLFGALFGGENLLLFLQPFKLQCHGSNVASHHFSWGFIWWCFWKKGEPAAEELPLEKGNCWTLRSWD